MSLLREDKEAACLGPLPLLLVERLSTLIKWILSPGVRFGGQHHLAGWPEAGELTSPIEYLGVRLASELALLLAEGSWCECCGTISVAACPKWRH